MKEMKLTAITAFENYKIELAEAGHVVVTTEVVDSSLNYYGNAHGGYLFTLCDQVSGLVGISLGDDVVTLQSNIHYLKAGHLGDRLSIEGTCTHNGRSTKLIEVTIHNQDGTYLAKATFTMFVTGKH